MPVDVLFTHRTDALIRPGGDTTHALRTMDELKRRGYRVFGDWEPFPQDFEPKLIHHFNISRPERALQALRRFASARLVVQALHVDYSSTESAMGGSRVLISRYLGRDGLEYLKRWARWLVGNQAAPTVEYALSGHGRSVRRLLTRAELVLVASNSEKQRIEADYGPHPNIQILYPPCALPVFSAEISRSKAVLCAARIEPLKNQLNLIRALNDSEFELILAGSPAPNHRAYADQCKAESGSGVQFVGQLDTQDLFDAYASSEVCALPSHFETTGLSTVEALAAGIPAVCGGGEAVREIFGPRATYCDPKRPESILEAVRIAQNKTLEQRKADSNWANDAFSSAKIGQQLVGFYEEVLSQNRPNQAS